MKKKLQTRFSAISILFLLASSALLTSCAKDEADPSGGGSSPTDSSSQNESMPIYNEAEVAADKEAYRKAIEDFNDMNEHPDNFTTDQKISFCEVAVSAAEQILRKYTKRYQVEGNPHDVSSVEDPELIRGYIDLIQQKLNELRIVKANEDARIERDFQKDREQKEKDAKSEKVPELETEVPMKKQQDDEKLAQQQEEQRAKEAAEEVQQIEEAQIDEKFQTQKAAWAFLRISHESHMSDLEILSDYHEEECVMDPIRRVLSIRMTQHREEEGLLVSKQAFEIRFNVRSGVPIEKDKDFVVNLQEMSLEVSPSVAHVLRKTKKSSCHLQLENVGRMRGGIACNGLTDSLGRVFDLRGKFGCSLKWQNLFK